jgi:hypothetical protein
MHSADFLGFTKRQAGVGIIGVHNLLPGQNLRQPNIASASIVVLKKGEERIMVCAVSRVADGSYKGIIEGFNTSVATEFENMKLADEISFREEHVFSLNE